MYLYGSSVAFPLSVSLGGTGLTALGAADTMLGVNDAGTANIYKTKFKVTDAGIVTSGTANFSSWFSIENLDASLHALTVKHLDASGNHNDLFRVLDATGITEYIKIDYVGQSEFQNLTMRNLFGETVLDIQDLSGGASVHFGTSFTDPSVPGDGFSFYANPFGGAPTWVNASSEYLGFLLTGAGTDTANVTYFAVSDQNAGTGSIYSVVGQYNPQPCLFKRLGQSLTTVSTTATQNALCDGIVGGANITGTVTVINGITAPESTYSTVGRAGSRFVIRNKSTNIITINHLNGSASAADQIRTPNGLPFYLMPEQGCEVHYDTGSSKWRFIADVSDDGVWTPTLTNTANVAASTAYECRFMTHGKRVFCSGRVDIDPTTTLTLTQLRMSLPIASNLGGKNDASGNFTTEGLNETGVIFADAASDTVEFNFTPVDVTNKTRWFNFSYERI
jgi:hypothetical protein